MIYFFFTEGQGQARRTDKGKIDSIQTDDWLETDDDG